MNKTLIIVIVAVILVLCACTAAGIGGYFIFRDSGDETITTTGKKVIEDVPYEINEFMTTEDIAELEAAGFKIYKGFNAPTLDGSYNILDWSIDYDKMGEFEVGQEIATSYITFTNQTDEGTIDVALDVYGGERPNVSNGKDGYISGKNGCFTTYQQLVGSYDFGEYECTDVQLILASGCVDESGIQYFQYANKMDEVTGDSRCFEEYMSVGNIRIITDKSGLVEPVR